MLRAAVAVPAGTSASVTLTVKLIGPVTLPVGVPVIAPVPPFNVKPAGSAPTLIDQAYGVMPPVAPASGYTRYRASHPAESTSSHSVVAR